MEALPKTTEQELEERRLREWVRGCLAKRRYVNEDRAKQAICNHRKFKHRARWFYYCTHCGGYHLTSRPQQ